jgi:hypothetical protein
MVKSHGEKHFFSIAFYSVFKENGEMLGGKEKNGVSRSAGAAIAGFVR